MSKSAQESGVHHNAVLWGVVCTSYFPSHLVCWNQQQFVDIYKVGLGFEIANVNFIFIVKVKRLVMYRQSDGNQSNHHFVSSKETSCKKLPDWSWDNFWHEYTIIFKERWLASGHPGMKKISLDKASEFFTWKYHPKERKNTYVHN